MTALIENMRKVMGWCPNADAIEFKKTVHFDKVGVNAPDAIGGLPQMTSGLWGKYRNRILLGCFFATLLAIEFFYLHGMANPYLFITGVITGTVFSIISWITEWKRLNRVGAGKYIQMSVSRRKKIIKYLIIAGLIIVTMSVGVFILANTGISGYYAFFSGMLFFAWTQYFQVLYWEWKNRKTLIVNKTSFFAVDIETE